MTTFPSPGPAEHPFPLDTGDHQPVRSEPDDHPGVPQRTWGHRNPPTSSAAVTRSVRFRNGRTRQLSADRLRRG
jgi:hypothetical protein